MNPQVVLWLILVSTLPLALWAWTSAYRFRAGVMTFFFAVCWLMLFLGLVVYAALRRG